jgi:uncharacterized iron-regulated protein
MGGVCTSLWLCGCGGVGRVNLADRTGGSAALFGQFRAYDGHTGRPLSFAEVARRCAGADVVFFGEQHSDSVCNQLEAQLLAALARQKRPVALALEFFEADTQASLDAYLNGRIDEAAFRQQTRQGREYVLSHRPLLELCRATRIPVLAANAPRRLVRAYRTSGLDYEEFRAGLAADEQRWLPLQSGYLTGPYEARFFETMAGHEAGGGPPPPATTAPATGPTTAPTAAAMSEGPRRMPTGAQASAPSAPPAPSTMPTQPAATAGAPPVSQPVGRMSGAMNVDRFYRAQLLWDEAMADALVNFRERFPKHRVMLVVGGFHVQHDGGTAAKFRTRRPHDRVCTLAYSAATDGRLALDQDDRDAGEIVLYGIAPPPEEKLPSMPAPQTSPAGSAPTTTPSSTAPAPMPPLEPPTTEAVTTQPVATKPVGVGGQE